MLLEIDKNNESTTTNADNNVYMKYMSDFIIYLYIMDKLIELIYYYNFEVKTFEVGIGLPNSDTGYYGWTIDKEKEIRKYKLMIISKEYGFIKWLVDNDKIDLKEFHRLCGIINQDSEYWNGTPQEYEQVIMYLSISDTPIEDLVSLLK